MKNIYSLSSYRQILQSELQVRISGNPRYSMRAFARDLGLASHRLSEILGGKVGLSRNRAEALCQQMRFSRKEAAYFCDLVEKEHGRKEIKRRAAAERVLNAAYENQHKAVLLDTFSLIAEWYHFALLELMTLADFRVDPDWMADRLSISRRQVDLALGRLVRLGFIEYEGSRVRLIEDRTSVAGTPASTAIRAYHVQILEKALCALKSQRDETREFSSTIVAIERKRLPEAKQLVKDFWRSFCRTMNTSKRKDSVYCLAVQLFALTEGD